MATDREPGPALGIVTALPVECFAVLQMLDDVVEVEAPDGRDESVYYAGTLPSLAPGRPHRIVVTVLTEDAGIAAANACTNMERSWGVEVIIMCGIALGVPAPGDPSRHVRLGDILVASEGVVPYGHLRVYADGEELRRQASLPSARLKRAVARLRTEEESGARPWEEFLRGRGPAMRQYRRPDPATDVVYVDEESDEFVPHPVQPHRRPGQPLVHYGRLGSGGKLIRSGAERDRLASAYRLIGFDMEGDGVSETAYLQSVDWWMIRAASDYGVRKNDEWQRYAAWAAAAYTRALLRRLPASNADNYPTRSTPPTAAALPIARLAPVVTALLTLPTLTDPRRRQALINDLPDRLAARIPRAGNAYGDTVAVVRAMSTRPAGLRELGELLVLHEGESDQLRGVLEILRRAGPG
ncbi:hypothetical protein [Actinoplanes sp. NPDC049599]|uniref:effector-associated domain 2-containing protein n=1 Tax=Actinoplanes sp. NPDC049599 TaxID=3363903 RepID=UPI0037924B4E